MASEVLQATPYRLSAAKNVAPRPRSSDCIRLVGRKPQELWSGFQHRLGSTSFIGAALGSQKGDRVTGDSDSDSEEGDVMQESLVSNGLRATERVRCRSVVEREDCASDPEDSSSLLSAAQKAGCFSYIKRRYSIALAFASTDSSEDTQEPSHNLMLEQGDAIASNWEPVKTKNGVQLFKSKRSRCEVLGVTLVNASVKNVMSILAAGSTTEAFLDAQKIILGTDQVIEAKVLASCAEPTTSRYFHCGLKYQAMKNPFGTTPLDLVYLDYTDVSTTSDGKLIGYRIIESIRVPELRTSPKYVRASIRCEVYTVQETDTPGVVEVTFASHLDPKSKCSSRRSQWLEQAGVRLSNLRAHAEKTSIGNHVLSDPKRVVVNRKHRSFTSGDKDKQQRNCNVCQHAFSFLRKRHDCRVCGDVSCGRCCRKMAVLVGLESTRVKVCLSCILHSRNNPDEIRRGELGQRSSRRDISNTTFIIYDE
uniref:FYVE-type domain-containing protein n=1 Tax=Peronospora matthiolae TaxID=2874970 RepID=A0AAV1UMJ8_9STRA